MTNVVNGFQGIAVNAGTTSGDAGVLRLDMQGNTASTNSGNSDFLTRQRFSTTVALLNYGGANNNDAAVETYLDVTKANNATGSGTWFISNNAAGGGGGFVNTASVPTPTLPSP